MLALDIDISIIDHCKLRDAKAQELLYRKCYPVFMKICLRYARNYDDASNILQESFIKVFLKIQSYSGTGDVVGWMKKIVVNTAIDHVRKESKMRMISMDRAIGMEVAAEESHAEAFVLDESQVLKWIGELPPNHLLVFNLFVMENYSHQEIADQLGITVSSSKWYLHESRKILNEKKNLYIHERK